eukprot:CAMPEP_0117694620 /NCGR_PEP_ID=MMETSP0804-20121206/27600_1 /TAXON_ID=1074897 /ORGANISM="Tetraselmis astigmatica, Strain CCMP880" /LENGTH=617 /DNA_ID=CAMNT_0005508431 /DNA_START=240 /DNA_END=2091 /DNA_ORIENTATION=-
MSSQAFSLLRAVVTQDGRVKANFNDNTVLLLDSTGTTFTVCKPDGTQLSEYAVSSHQRKVAVALEFRNTHTDQPYFCRALQLLGRETFQTGFPIPHATWPSLPTEAAKKGLLDAKDDNTYVLCSEDDMARMVLSPYARRLAVTYPLQVTVEEGPRRHTFVWQTQVFWVQDCPRRWLPALQVLLAAAGAEPVPGEQPQLSGRAATVRTALPQSDGAAAAAAARQGGAWAAFPPGTWWCECSTSLFPADCPLLSEWRREAMYHFDTVTGEVQAVIHHDGSVLESFQGGSYFRHCRVPASLGEMVYAATAVPQQVRGADGSSRYDLGTIAAHALAFREAAVRLAAAHPAHEEPRDSRKAAWQSNGDGAPQKENRPPGGSGPQPRNRQQLPAPAAPSALSASVKETREEPGVGRFTSYEDGRVRAVFRDRTILEMDTTRASARILFPDASHLTVNVANPIGVEEYVAAAKQFADWSFSSAEERLEAYRTMQAAQEEMAKCTRMQEMLEWTIHGTVPEAADVQGANHLPGPLPHVSTADQLPAAVTETDYSNFGGEELSKLVQQYLDSNSQILQRLSQGIDGAEGSHHASLVAFLLLSRTKSAGHWAPIIREVLSDVSSASM